MPSLPHGRRSRASEIWNDGSFNPFNPFNSFTVRLRLCRAVYFVVHLHPLVTGALRMATSVLLRQRFCFPSLGVALDSNCTARGHVAAEAPRRARTQVNPTFNPTGGTNLPPLIPLAGHDSPQGARVEHAQQLLFPSAPRAVCDQLGLNWWAALKLYEDGWLSFCPETTPTLDEAQEAELRFVGSLVLAGCDRSMLVALLSGLSKPYAYQGNRLYYDWPSRHWRVLPEPHPHPEAVFADWLETLVDDGDINSLTGILELTHDALARLRHPGGPAHPPRPASPDL
jgi:hypothetical protein